MYARVRMGLVGFLRQRRPILTVQGDLDVGGQGRADYTSWFHYSTGTSKRKF